MAKKSVTELLAEAITLDEVTAIINSHKAEILKNLGFGIIAYAWKTNSSRTPHVFSTQRDRVPKDREAIELWTKI